jgi:hypothetical protein
MAKFQFNGEVAVVYPTLGLTVQPGDVFEAPDGFDAPFITASRAKVTVTSDAEPATADLVAPVEDAPADAPADNPTTTSEDATGASAESTTN